MQPPRHQLCSRPLRPRATRRLIEDRVPIHAVWLVPGVPLAEQAIRGDRLLLAADRAGWRWSSEGSWAGALELRPPEPRSISEVVSRWDWWLRFAGPQREVLAKRGYVPVYAKIGVPGPRSRTFWVTYAGPGWTVTLSVWTWGVHDLGTLVEPTERWLAPTIGLHQLQPAGASSIEADARLLARILDGKADALAQRVPRMPPEIRALFDALLQEGWWFSGSTAEPGNDEALVPNWFLARGDLELVASGPHPNAEINADVGPSGWSLSLRRRTGGVSEFFPMDLIARRLGCALPTDWAQRADYIRAVLAEPDLLRPPD